MNYTKRPVTIQAWQLNLKDSKNIVQMYELVNNVDVSTMQMIAESYIHDEISRHGGLPIVTLEGKMIASDGDYIIRGIKGEFYPCKPDVFEKTYMPEIDAKEYIARLRKLANSGCDKEVVYKVAGEILCDALNLFGQEKLTKEFKDIVNLYE